MIVFNWATMAESENPYQVSRASIETYGSVQEGIQYSFGRMLGQGLGAFFSTLPITLVTALVFGFIYLASGSLWICGGFIIVPHLFAGLVAYGSSAVDRKPKLEELFLPFNRFGPIFVAGLLYLVFFLGIGILLTIIALVMAGLGAGIATAVMEGSNTATGNSDDAIIGITMMVTMGVIYLSTLYFLGRLDLVFPLIYELDVGAWDAFTHSWRLTRGHGISMMFAKLLIYTIPIILISPLWVLFFIFAGASWGNPEMLGDSAGLLLIFYAVLLLVIGPISLGLRMTLEGAIANLYLTESVKQQLVPNYQERRAGQFVTSPPPSTFPGQSAPGPSTGQPGGMSAGSAAPTGGGFPFTGASGVGQGHTEPATGSRGAESSSTERSGEAFGPPPSSPNRQDRFPGSPGSEDKKKDPFNPYS